VTDVNRQESHVTPSASETFFSRSGADDQQLPWTWRCQDAGGAEVTPGDHAVPSFPSQADAESWLGEEWRALLEAGVESVTLLEGDREVYGPMSLRA
jgi:hypothetical protein